MAGCTAIATRGGSSAMAVALRLQRLKRQRPTAKVLDAATEVAAEILQAPAKAQKSPALLNIRGE